MFNKKYTSIMEGNMNQTRGGQNNNMATRNENKKNSKVTRIALIGGIAAVVATAAVFGIKKLRAKKQQAQEPTPKSNKEE